MGFKEEVNEIKGVGKDTVQNILQKFSNWNDINKADLGEIKEIKGVGEKTAKLLKKKSDNKKEIKTIKGVILNYRTGGNSQKNNQAIIKTQLENPNQLIGKKVKYKTKSGKSITGNVITQHGKGKKVLVNFDKGLPGQALGSKVEVK